MARDALATLPNLVSLSRLVMAALFPFFPGTAPRLVLIGAAGVTDFLDGYLARTRGSSSRMGAMIDPFADRCFLIVAVFVLWTDGTITLPQLLMLGVRDMSLLTAWIIARATGFWREFRFLPRIAGKVLTVMQLAALALAYIAPQWIMATAVVVCITSLVAIAEYVIALARSRPAAAIAILVAGLAATAEPASAQAFTFAPTVQPEISASAAVSAGSGPFAGVALNVPAGYYVRIANGLSFGRELGTAQRNSVRADMTARFLVDPFAESRWGPYAGGGAFVAWREGDAGRVGLLLIVGADLPFRGHWRPAIEVGVGGGARLSLIFKRARTSGR